MRGSKQELGQGEHRYHQRNPDPNSTEALREWMSVQRSGQPRAAAYWSKPKHPKADRMCPPRPQGAAAFLPCGQFRKENGASIIVGVPRANLLACARVHCLAQKSAQVSAPLRRCARTGNAGCNQEGHARQTSSIWICVAPSSGKRDVRPACITAG